MSEIDEESRFLKMAKKLHEVRAEMHNGVVDRDNFHTAINHLDQVIVYLGVCEIKESKKETP